MIGNRRTFIRLLACLLLFGSVALAADKAKDQPTTKKSEKRPTVRMKDKGYSPSELTVKVGDTVVWKNDDDHDHTVIADDKSFKSGNISPDDTFEYKFAKAGKFKYSCKYHPRMKGTITVESEPLLTPR
jgi:plastocyanin